MIENQFDRVALTPPGFLKRREWRLQSQPQDLQYHSVMPSHSSRSARMALPALTALWSAGVMTPWRTGMTTVLAHSGHVGMRFGRFLAARLAGIQLQRNSKNSTSDHLFQVSPFSVEASSPWMQWDVKRRFFVVGTELAHADGLEIVAWD